MECPYCNARAVLVLSKIVYGKDYGKMWICSNYPNCDTYVGCHKGTDTPLGNMANASLRKLRIATHLRFDNLWKTGRMKRGKAYSWLSKVMDLSIQNTHIGNFSERQCKDAISFINSIRG